MAFRSTRATKSAAVSKIWGCCPPVGMLWACVPAGIATIPVLYGEVEAPEVPGSGAPMMLSTVNCSSTLDATPGASSYPIARASSRIDRRSVAVRKYPSFAMRSW